MTVPTQENQVQDQNLSNKELNFRALEQKYQQQLAQERAERERLARELQQRQNIPDVDDEDEPEPYVDHKRLKKEQARFGQQLKQETQSEIQKAVQTALAEERKNNWIKQNNDFQEVMSHAQKFADSYPDLADTILQMPEGFERQKLVYHTIKSKGLHKPEEPKPSIQDKIDANRRSPYYQPSNVGTAPYSQAADFSPAGQKQAYEKLQALKAKYGM